MLHLRIIAPHYFSRHHIPCISFSEVSTCNWVSTGNWLSPAILGPKKKKKKRDAADDWLSPDLFGPKSLLTASQIFFITWF